jgi:hypothetical protein
LGVIYKDRDNLDRAVECYQVGFTGIFLGCHYLSWPLTPVARTGIFRGNSETETRVHFAVVWDGSWPYGKIIIGCTTNGGVCVVVLLAVVVQVTCWTEGTIAMWKQMALAIKPNFSQSLNNLGVVYTIQVC